jgi:chromosome segregation ATPase
MSREKQKYSATGNNLDELEKLADLLNKHIITEEELQEELEEEKKEIAGKLEESKKRLEKKDHTEAKAAAEDLKKVFEPVAARLYAEQNPSAAQGANPFGDAFNTAAGPQPGDTANKAENAPFKEEK